MRQYKHLISILLLMALYGIARADYHYADRERIAFNDKASDLCNNFPGLNDYRCDIFNLIYKRLD